MQLILKVRGGLGWSVLAAFVFLIACTEPSPTVPVTPSVITLPDLKPEPKPPEPKPPEPVDGVLEIGTGDRPTLTVHAFYDVDKNDERGPQEIALKRAGLRLTPVKDGPNGTQRTGPGRIVRTSKEGVLLARVPPGLYSLEFVNVVSPGEDPNAAQWVLTAQERIEINKDQSLDLPAFCLVETIIQPGPVGVCTPEYDLKPRAFLAAVPSEVSAGQISTLRFRADDEATVTLEPFGAVESFRETDFFERTVKPEATTTYTLLAKNGYATREVKATVTVNP
jgi:hypothetical protein